MYLVINKYSNKIKSETSVYVWHKILYRLTTTVRMNIVRFLQVIVFVELKLSYLKFTNSFNDFVIKTNRIIFKNWVGNSLIPGI